MGQVHWETERMREIARMKRIDEGFDPNRFKLNERVKTQAVAQFGDVLVPQWSRGTVVETGDGRVQVQFDHFGSHHLSSEQAGRLLMHEQKKTPTDVFRAQFFNEMRKNSNVGASLNAGATVLDEDGSPLLVAAVGPNGVKLTVTDENGATFIRHAQGLIETDTSNQGQRVVVTGPIDADNFRRPYPMQPGEETSIIGSEADIQFSFTPENGNTIYRVLTQYGVRDLSANEVKFVGESKIMGLAPQPSLGVASGTMVKLTAEQVAKHSPGTRVDFEGREGTVMEKFDQQLMVAFDDGSIEYVGIEEMGAKG